MILLSKNTLDLDVFYSTSNIKEKRDVMTCAQAWIPRTSSSRYPCGGISPVAFIGKKNGAPQQKCEIWCP